MKTLFAIGLVAASSLSFNTQANEKVGLFLKDYSLESRVCLAAATEGLDAAKAVAKMSTQSFKRFTKHLECNGDSVTATAERYNGVAVAVKNDSEQSRVKKNVVLVANSNKESQVCADAAAVGIERAAANHGLTERQMNRINCNDAPISEFVDQFKAKNVQISAD